MLEDTTGDRRYAREYCCSFEKSCLFFLKVGKVVL